MNSCFHQIPFSRGRSGFFLILLLTTFPFFSFSQSDDKNVVIESKIQEFTFSRSKGDHPVIISEKYSEKYRCNEVRTSVVFSEMYNLNESIEDVDIKVDGKKAKGITPHDDYYSVQEYFLLRRQGLLF